MTKKDYETIAKAIAKAIANARTTCEPTSKEDEEVLEAVVVELTLVFEKDNPRFDRDRFAKACGVDFNKMKSITDDADPAEDWPELKMTDEDIAAAEDEIEKTKSKVKNAVDKIINKGRKRK